MKTYLGFASALMVASTQAFEWNDVLNAIQTFTLMYGTARDAYESFDINDYKPQFHSRHDVRNYLKTIDRRVKPLTKEQRHMAVQAHHSIMDRRERMGLPKVGAAAGPVVGQNYAALDSFYGNLLNMLSGMQYNTAGSDSACYDAAESLIIGLDTSSDVFAKLYIPAYWSELQVQVQDLTAILAATFVDCNLDKMFTTLTHLASSEGVSELTGRVAGAAFFEFSKCLDVYSNP